METSQTADTDTSGDKSMTSEEVRRILFDFNRTEGDLPATDVLAPFARVVELHPEKIAVHCEGRALSYARLDGLASALAGHLRAAEGIRKGDRVGVMLERKEILIVSILAVWKSGAVYVPLDSEQPEERLKRIAEQADLKLLLISPAWAGRASVLSLKGIDPATLAAGETSEPSIRLDAGDPAYVMFTSGSTGIPKGVLVSHGNLANFAEAMRIRVKPRPDEVILALTAVTFDISLLELVWPLTVGIGIRLHPGKSNAFNPAQLESPPVGVRKTAVSLFFFGSYGGGPTEDYDLLLESARIADREGFESIWFPERHFARFGGAFPNPAVLAGAVAAVTKRVKIRAGSVLPSLHDPIRVAEEWAMADRLSHGRVGISVAKGWNPDDFVLNPAAFARKEADALERLEAVRTLWRGGTLTRANGQGRDIQVGILPRPVQPELPVWLTTTGKEDSFLQAGRLGLNVLTHFLNQEPAELARKIALYRKAGSQAGHDPSRLTVTVMVHAYAGESLEACEAAVKAPLLAYLRSSLDLFRAGAGSQARGGEEDGTMEAMVEAGFGRIFNGTGLFGTVPEIRRRMEILQDAGVDEIACLVDFGVEREATLASLGRLAEAARNLETKGPPAGGSPGEADLEAPHAPTMLQTTPSLLRMIANEAESGEFLSSLRTVLVGGEALTIDLYRQLREKTGARVLNMYGPTETTVWSSCHEMGEIDERILVGKPVLNTRFYVLDSSLSPVQVLEEGELYIGGAGVAIGYLKDPARTAEMFPDNPFVPGDRLYRTGDRARWMGDGNLELLGRQDSQVKINGHRVELEEIQAALRTWPGIKDAVVLLDTTAPSDPWLEAFLESDRVLDEKALSAAMAERVPAHMLPREYRAMTSFPKNSSGKTDRKALGNLPRTKNRSLGEPSVLPPHPPGTAFPRDALTPTEAKLQAIWAEVFGKADIGPDENFFSLGGHSMRAVKALSRITETFGPVIKLPDFYQRPTIRKLAAFIGQKNGPIAEPAGFEDLKHDFELSPSQFRLWYQQEKEPGNPIFNEIHAFNVPGTFRKAAFLEAIRKVIRNHEMLRAAIFLKDGMPRQSIADEERFHVTITPTEAVPGGIDGIPDYFKSIAQIPFDLDGGYLHRIAIVDASPSGFQVLFVLHHLICDGWSFNLLLRDLVLAYGRSGNLPGLPGRNKRAKYFQYIEWLASSDANEMRIRSREYWKSRSEQIEERFTVPEDLIPAGSTESAMVGNFPFGAELSRSLGEACARWGVTPFGILLTALNTLIHRYTGNRDAFIGTPFSGRGEPRFDEVVGLFVGVLPIRVDISPQESFASLLEKTVSRLGEAHEHQMFPPESGSPMGSGANALPFDVVATFTDGNGGRISLDDDLVSDRMDPIEIPGRQARFPAIFEFSENRGEYGLKIEFDAAKYSRDRMDSVASHFLTLLRSSLEGATRNVGELELLPLEELKRVLELSAGKSLPLSRTGSLGTEIAAVAMAYPESLALESATGGYTYRELDRLSEKIAAYIEERGSAASGKVIGVELGRCAESIISMVGIMKAGCAYAYLDPALPEARKRLIMESAGIGLSLTEATVQKVFASEIRESRRQSQTGPEDIAYVMFTSGTTGAPNAVMVTHKAILNLVDSHFRIPSESRVSLTCEMSFDVSVADIYPALLAGATLVIPDKEVVVDPSLFAEFLFSRRINFAFVHPMHLRTVGKVIYAQGQAGLKGILSGVESIDYRDISEFLKAGVQVMIGYGPTETTVYSTAHILERPMAKSGQVPIGRPIHNTEIILTDAAGRLSPMGFEWEILIGGMGLAKGYLNDPALTARKFVHGFMGKRWYRTGDTAKFTPEGLLHFTGRKDRQAKIRGYRIEAGEIESAIMASGLARECRVFFPEDPEIGKRIVAACRLESDAQPEELEKSMALVLPDYMAPAQILVLPELPATVNGKVDIKKLIEVANQSYRDRGRGSLPIHPKKAGLKAIWEELLALEGIGPEDSFFKSGGNSIKVMQLRARVARDMGVEIGLKEIYDYPTLSSMSYLIKSKRKSAQPPLLVAPAGAYFPLTYSQRSIWTYQRMNPASDLYNIAVAVELSGPFDFQSGAKAFESVSLRHEATRTVFPIRDGEPFQRVLPSVHFEMRTLESAAGPGNGENLRNRIIELSRFPFDLENGPLVRLFNVKAGPSRNILLFVIHHLVSDGWSIAILFREFFGDYLRGIGAIGGGEKPPGLQFRDAANWEATTLAGPGLESAERFWLAQLTSAPKRRHTRTLTEGERKQYSNGLRLEKRLGAGLCRAIATFSDENSTSVFSALFLATYLVLRVTIERSSRRIGIPIQSRQRAEFEDVVGYFVNTLPVRPDIGFGATVAEAIKQAHGQIQDWIAHAYYPGALLFEKFPEFNRGRAGMPFDYLIGLEDDYSVFNTEFKLPDHELLQVRNFEIGAVPLHAEMSIRFRPEKRGEYSVSVVCDPNIYGEEALKGFCDSVISLLGRMMGDTGRRLADIAIPSFEDPMSRNQIRINL